MIIDEDRGMVGSQNLDFLSFDFNAEIGVFFYDKETVAELRKIADNWEKNSKIFDHTTYKPGWIDYILSPVIKFLSIII
mgnify:CR=1 FL=1